MRIDGKMGENTCFVALEDYAGLVRKIAGRFAGRGYDMDDIIQSGFVGLAKAKRGYNGELGGFIPYAFPFVIGEIREAMRCGRLIKLPRTALKNALEIKTALDALVAENGALGISEAAEKLGITRTELEENIFALEAALIPASLDEKAESDLRPFEQMTEGFESEKVEKIYLSSLVARLTADERAVIDMRYSKDKTQSETASALKITQSAVSKIEKNALMKLRIFINADK